MARAEPLFLAVRHEAGPGPIDRNGDDLGCGIRGQCQVEREVAAGERLHLADVDVLVHGHGHPTRDVAVADPKSFVGLRGARHQRGGSEDENQFLHGWNIRSRHEPPMSQPSQVVTENRGEDPGSRKTEAKIRGSGLIAPGKPWEGGSMM